MRARANRSSDPTSLIDTFWRYRGAVGAPLPFALLGIDTYGATFCTQIGVNGGFYKQD
jgi:hypothetical protein